MKIKRVQNKSQMIEYGVVIVIGLAGGIAVGGGYVAFLAVLGVIPRLAQLTRSGHRVQFLSGP